MPRHYQDNEIEFHREPRPIAQTEMDEKPRCTDIRGVVVYFYGGTIEEGIAEARKRLCLGNDWEVVQADKSRVG